MRTPRPAILLDGDLGWLALVAAAAVGLFLSALTLRLGGFIMRRGLMLAALAAVAVSLSGCAEALRVLQPADPGVPSVLGNLQGCTRTYRGAIGVGVTGSFDISCTPQPPLASPHRSAPAEGEPVT